MFDFIEHFHSIFVHYIKLVYFDWYKLILYIICLFHSVRKPISLCIIQLSQIQNDYLPATIDFLVIVGLRDNVGLMYYSIQTPMSL